MPRCAIQWLAHACYSRAAVELCPPLRHAPLQLWCRDRPFVMPHHSGTGTCTLLVPHRGVHEVWLVLVLQQAACAHDDDVRPRRHGRDVEVGGVDIDTGRLEALRTRLCMHLIGGGEGGGQGRGFRQVTRLIGGQGGVLCTRLSMHLMGGEGGCLQGAGRRQKGAAGHSLAVDAS